LDFVLVEGVGLSVVLGGVGKVLFVEHVVLELGGFAGGGELVLDYAHVGGVEGGVGREVLLFVVFLDQ
jgi:hypothetical protein